MKIIILLFFVLFAASQPCDRHYPFELDMGYYVLAPDMTWHKSCNWNISAHLIPNRKTMTFVHGAQPDYVREGKRFFELREPEIQSLFGIWIQSGYNVMVYDWTQFADESLVNMRRIQSKSAWSCNAYNGMEYRYITSDLELAIRTDKECLTVAERLARDHKIHFSSSNGWDVNDIDNPESEIHYVSHSLGVGPVLNSAFFLVTDKLNGQMSYKTPQRLALLDPVFSPFPEKVLLGNPCGTEVVDVLGCRAKLLGANEIAIEMHKSSNINNCLKLSTNYPPLIEAVAFSRTKLFQFGDIPLGDCYKTDIINNDIKNTLVDISKQMTQQHSLVIAHYFLSKIHPPRRCTYVDGTCNAHEASSLALSAAMSTKEVKVWQNTFFRDYGKACFTQFDDGTRMSNSSVMNFDPADDLFYTQPCEYANY